MIEKVPKPLINVEETGKNFRMIDCEFEMGKSERPILETKAENTTLEGTRVTTHNESSSSVWSRVVWKILAPLVVAVAGGVLLYLLVGKT